jgi:anti-sigma regulatory factor (Ser/Thr protein kinase)/serine/threonine protein phosphatase PrpC
MAAKLTDRGEVQSITSRVSGRADVLISGQLSREFAALLGFPAIHCDEIELVVIELASNLVRHAVSGTIHLSQVRWGERTGMEIQSSDSGPGIFDVEQAMKDRYSNAGGLGLGLGTVNRLMEDLQICTVPNGGTLIVCRRWLPAQFSLGGFSLLAFGAATRSFGQLPENGDAYLIKQWERNALVGVIDGLGHGQFAQLASQTARQHVEQHFDEPLEHLFSGTGRACRATRGVVMALARFDLDRHKLTVASVGNIEVRLSGMDEPFSPAIRRGIVGLNAVKPHATEHAWTSNSLLVMHSDGLRSDWELSKYREEMWRIPNVTAQRLLNEMGRTDDDATIVVARSAA